MVDTSFSAKDIRTAFEVYLKRWVKKTKLRKRDSAAGDIWKVYRLKEHANKNFSEITREIIGIEDIPKNLPSCNADVMASYKQIKRAYEKACKIIEMVESSAIQSLDNI